MYSFSEEEERSVESLPVVNNKTLFADDSLGSEAISLLRE
jgi:hypothetical protein